MFGDKNVWVLNTCENFCPSDDVKNEQKSGEGEFWALFPVVFKELCEVNRTFIKER